MIKVEVKSEEKSKLWNWNRMILSLMISSVFYMTQTIAYASFWAHFGLVSLWAGLKLGPDLMSENMAKLFYPST